MQEHIRTPAPRPAAPLEMPLQQRFTATFTHTLCIRWDANASSGGRVCSRGDPSLFCLRQWWTGGKKGSPCCRERYRDAAKHFDFTTHLRKWSRTFLLDHEASCMTFHLPVTLITNVLMERMCEQANGTGQAKRQAFQLRHQLIRAGSSSQEARLPAQPKQL